MIGFGKCVLVVNEMETVRRLLAEMLEQQGFTVVQASDGIQALCEMEQRHVDVMVTDYHLPRLNGLGFPRQSQVVWPGIPVILFSELEWDTSDLTEARGAFAWIRQSSDPGILLSMLALALAQGVEWEPRRAMEWIGA